MSEQNGLLEKEKTKINQWIIIFCMTSLVERNNYVKWISLRNIRYKIYFNFLVDYIICKIARNTIWHMWNI